MKRTIFCHIRKTGGTTLHRIFQNAVGATDISPGHGSEQYSKALSRWEMRRVISQHVWFAPGESLSTERVNLTVLREPIDRCVSNYFYVRAQDPAFRADAPERSLSLSEFAFSESAHARAEMQNHQTKLLAPIGLAQALSSPSEDQLLSAAKLSLEQFDIVGLTERLEDTVDLVSFVTGMAPITSIPKERATASRLSIDDVPLDVRRKLKRDNRLDEELYAYAYARFKALKRKCFIVLLDLKHNSPTTNLAEVLAGPNANSHDQKGNQPSRSSLEQRYSPRRFGTREIEITEVTLSGSISLGAPEFISGETLSITLRCRSRIASKAVTVGLHIHDAEGRLVYGTNIWHFGKSIEVFPNSTFEVVFQFQITMGTGRYLVGAALHTGNSHLDQCFDWCDRVASFGVVGAIGLHFDGNLRLVPSLEFKCNVGDAQMQDREDIHGGFVGFGRHNRPIALPDGYVRSIPEELNVRCGESFAIELEIANDGDIAWEEDGRRCAKLCYRWLGAGGVALVEEGERNSIGGDLLPGNRRRVWITAKAPFGHFGSTTLRVTLLQEHVAWFDQMGKLFCDIPVTILSENPAVTAATDAKS
jgi:hypothetical protein